MPASSALIQFQDRRSAYAFVAELRRLGDLDELSTLRVHAAAGDLFVEVPPQKLGYGGLRDLAGRFGGRIPASCEELERLRAAVAAAKDTARRTSERLAQARAAHDGAADIVGRARNARARRGDPANGNDARG